MNHNPSPATRFGGSRGNKPAGGNRWKKENTPRYKLERMMTLTKAEVQAIIDDESAPLYERQIATAIMHADWKTLERTINQVYGPPVQRVEQRDIPAPKPLLDVKVIKAQARELRDAA